MWDEKKIIKELNQYFDNTTKEKILRVLEECGCLQLMESADENKPYIQGFEVSAICKYNPQFGDDRICECGHSYDRHFDSYEDMSPVGCKYCDCYDFKEKIE